MWGEDGFDGLTNATNVALLLLCLRIKLGVVREVAQSPNDDTCHEDDTTHLLEILLAFLPSMATDRLPGRETVRWQLHHEWGILALDNETGEDAAQYHCHEDAHEIE